MTTANTRKGAPSVLRIEGEMTIYRAAELKQTLCEALDRSEELAVDLAAVTELDSAGVQVLLFAKRQAQARRRILRLHAHSPAVLDVFELLDLGAYFDDAPAIPTRSTAGGTRSTAPEEVANES